MGVKRKELTLEEAFEILEETAARLRRRILRWRMLLKSINREWRS